MGIPKNSLKAQKIGEKRGLLIMGPPQSLTCSYSTESGKAVFVVQLLARQPDAYYEGNSVLN